MAENTFRPFDNTDWIGMAGATSFADGSNPLVTYELRVDGLEAFAVIDANGFYMQILTPEGYTVSEIFSSPENAAAVFRFIATLKFSYTTGELIDMGLEPIRAN